jgi:hypothetical protein
MRRVTSILVFSVVVISLGGCVSQQHQQSNKAAYNALPAEFRSQVRECEKEYRLNSVPGSAEREVECVREAQGKVAEWKHVMSMPMSKEAKEAVEAEHPALARAEQRQHSPGNTTPAKVKISSKAWAEARKECEADHGESISQAQFEADVAQSRSLCET